MASQQNKLIELLADLEEESVLALVRQRVGGGDDPLKIIEECNAGMRQVGERYEQGQYFLSGLIMAGEIFREVVEIVQPVIVNRTPRQSSRRILLGTVQGDIHDIGKDMVGLSGVLTASFEMMRETVSLLRRMQQDGIAFPIIIGGGIIDDQICRYVGADYWVADAMSACTCAAN